MADPTARELWRLIEPIHAVVYFAPEAKEEYAAAGLKGGWMGYFASRSAPMGPVPAAVVAATFHGFHPAMVARAIPDAWAFASAERVVAARFVAVDRLLRRTLGDSMEGDGALVGAVRRVSELAAAATESADLGGRALAAGHASLTPPAEPHVAMWHWLSCLREHRGDGHVAALVAEGLDGCEANVLQSAAGRFAPAFQQSARGWSAEEWAAAAQRLVDRALLTDDAALSESGRALLARVEERTDALAWQPYVALGENGRAELAAALAPLGGQVAAGAALPYPNPMGLPQSR